MTIHLTTLPVPDPGDAPLGWTSSALLNVLSFGLSSTAQSDDEVQLCGSNDNTVAITSALALRNFVGFAGPANQQNAGLQGQALGAFQYYAIIRVGGTTTGLSFGLAGDDGTGDPVVLSRLTMAVPASGATGWTVGTLRYITSAGLSATAQSNDAVLLCGSNDNTAPVTSALSLQSFSGFAGPVNQQNAGLQGQALGAFAFYALIRTGGTTAGLNFNLVGGE